MNKINIKVYICLLTLRQQLFPEQKQKKTNKIRYEKRQCDF
jgi:hypothetical protein